MEVGGIFLPFRFVIIPDLLKRNVILCHSKFMSRLSITLPAQWSKLLWGMLLLLHSSAKDVIKCAVDSGYHLGCFSTRSIKIKSDSKVGRHYSKYIFSDTEANRLHQNSPLYGLIWTERLVGMGMCALEFLSGERDRSRALLSSGTSLNLAKYKAIN